mmetsp:Transcript_3902/g.10311  ORF Transcript_3902/g.10311 Transcript_3902/m.10311 type:complete len:214 (+) Transcript_3902:1045-1686(+)
MDHQLRAIVSTKEHLQCCMRVQHHRRRWIHPCHSLCDISPREDRVSLAIIDPPQDQQQPRSKVGGGYGTRPKLPTIVLYLRALLRQRNFADPSEGRATSIETGSFAMHGMEYNGALCTEQWTDNSPRTTASHEYGAQRTLPQSRKSHITRTRARARACTPSRGKDDAPPLFLPISAIVPNSKTNNAHPERSVCSRDRCGSRNRRSSAFDWTFP